MRAGRNAVIAVITFAAASAAMAAVNSVSITTRGGYRIIAANGIPDHRPGAFPNRGNPNSIREQRHTFRVPLRPRKAARITELRRQPFGVALNGVPFDPGTAEYWRGDPNWNYDALSGRIDLGLDRHNAHVQPNGAYHYHGVPNGLVSRRNAAGEYVLVGYAADGFPIYVGNARKIRSGYRLKRGQRQGGPGGRHDGTFVADWEYAPGAGTLDRCNGRNAKTGEYPGGTYAYFLTSAFPFIPRCFAGTPDPSFARRGPPPGMGRQGDRRGGDGRRRPPPGGGPPPGHPPPGFPPPGN